MKKRALVTATLFVLSLIVAAQVVRADNPMVVSIPFAFVAGNVTLPAGEYRVQKLDGNSAVLLISCADSSRSTMVLSNAAQANEIQTQSKLIFKRYENRYFLKQVWSEGSSRGRELLKSQAEKEIAQSARLETTGEVTLVARLILVRP
jgi:membrane-bound lytic murein transglycosylase